MPSVALDSKVQALDPTGRTLDPQAKPNSITRCCICVDWLSCWSICCMCLCTSQCQTRLGLACLDQAWPGLARPGLARLSQAMPGLARPRLHRHGLTKQGARLGRARPGMASLGQIWSGMWKRMRIGEKTLLFRGGICFRKPKRPSGFTAHKVSSRYCRCSRRSGSCCDRILSSRSEFSKVIETCWPEQFVKYVLVFAHS